MKVTISIIWFIFGVLFLCLGFSHFAESQKTILPLKITKRAMDKPDASVQVTIEMGGTDLDKPLEDFVNDFNDFLSELNKSSHAANRNTAWGYFFAAIIALISMLLEWRDDFIKHQKHKKQKTTNKRI